MESAECGFHISYLRFQNLLKAKIQNSKWQNAEGIQKADFPAGNGDRECRTIAGVRAVQHEGEEGNGMGCCAAPRCKAIDKFRIGVYIHTMRKELDMGAVENCACFNIRRVSRLITQFFDGEVRRFGLRPTQMSILGSLQAKTEWGMAELSEWLGMERTTLLRNLQPLQRDGLVRVKGGGRGGHVKLEITERGRKALTKMLPGWRSAQDKVVATLGKGRWSTIISDLGEAATKLKGE